MQTGLEAVGPIEPLKLRKVGPGKSWNGKYQAIELIQDHHFFSFSNPGHGHWPGSPRTKGPLELRKVGPGKSWIGKSQAIELIQDHHFIPFSNPGH